MSVPGVTVLGMGQREMGQRAENMPQLASVIAGFQKRALDIVGVHLENVEAMVVKAALADGLTQREAAALLSMSKSKVNRCARMNVDTPPKYREAYGALFDLLEEMLLGDSRASIVERARAYDRGRTE